MDWGKIDRKSLQVMVQKTCKNISCESVSFPLFSSTSPLMTDESPSKRWTDMTRYESKSLRPSGSERCLSPSSGKSSHSQKVPVLDPWPLPTWNQHKHEYNTGGIDILSHGLMNINLWVLPLRNYSNGRKKSQLKTYSATFLRDVQANLLGVNKKLPHVLVVIPCSQGARPCWQTWRWRKAQQKWRYNQFNQPKWGYNGTYNHTTSTFIYTWSENRYPPFWPFEWEKIW